MVTTLKCNMAGCHSTVVQNRSIEFSGCASSHAVLLSFRRAEDNEQVQSNRVTTHCEQNPTASQSHLHVTARQSLFISRGCLMPCISSRASSS
jgi:hypothetical protein